MLLKIQTLCCECVMYMYLCVCVCVRVCMCVTAKYGQSDCIEWLPELLAPLINMHKKCYKLNIIVIDMTFILCVK